MSARLRAWFRNAPLSAATSVAEAGDGDLVRLFAEAHDEAAFTELVRRHGPMVLATCRRVLHPDVHTADDAFQAAFLVLATRASTVSPPERVGAWLHGVAVHVARKAQRWVRKVAPSAPSDLDRLPAAALEADPDAAALRAKIDEVLAGLPAKYRAAVVLCDLQQRSRAEAAAQLGWSEGSLSGRLARARKLLADRLARRGVALPAGGLGVLLPASAATASVPVQLAASTIRTATLVAAGAATGEAVPASVAALARGVPMHSATFKLTAASLALAAVALSGYGLYTLAAPPLPPPDPPAPHFVAAPVPRERPGWAVKYTFTSEADIAALAFGPDLLAVGDEAGVLTLLESKTGARKERANVGAWKFKPIQRIQFLPDRTVRAITGWTENPQDFYYLDFLHPFDPDKMQAMHTQTPFGATADGAFNLVYDNDRRDITLWTNDPDAGKKGGATREARFRHEEVVEFAAADDANTVATVTGSRFKPALRLWSKGKGEPLWEVRLWEKVEKIDVTGVFVSLGGKLVAVTGDAGQVWVFDAATGKLVAKAGGTTGAAWSAAFSPDGKQIVAACEDKTARVYDTTTGQELAVLKGHEGAVIAVAFSSDGKQIATGGTDKAVKVWQVKADAPKPADSDPKAKHTYEHKHAVTAVAFSPDFVASGDENGVLTLWELKSGKQKTVLDGRAFKPIYHAQFLPGRVLHLVAEWTGGGKRGSGRREHLRIPFPYDDPKTMKNGGSPGATADGLHTFGLNGQDGRDFLLELRWGATRKHELFEGLIDAQSLTGMLDVQFRHKDRIAFASAYDANTVATITNDRMRPVLRFWSKDGAPDSDKGPFQDTDKPRWEVNLWKQIGNIDVTGVLVSPGGKLVAVTGDAGQVWVFDAATGKLVAKAGSVTGFVTSAAFSPDGKQIVAACEDKTARVYDTTTGQELAVLKGHTEAVTAVAFSPDGKQIVTGSSDKSVKVWEFKK